MEKHIFIICLEKFSSKAENQLLRSMFALDTLMCQVENDLEDLSPAKRNKRIESSSSDSEEDEDSSVCSASSSESDL